jgi:hypothetical protein
LIDQAGLDHWNGSTVGGTEIDAIIHEASAAAEVTGSELEARIAAELAEAREAMECV